MKVLRVACVILVALAVALATIWGAFAIYYSNISGAYTRPALAGLFVLSVIFGFVSVKPRRRAFILFIFLFAGIATWWMTIPPSNDRDWQRDVAVLPYAEVSGDRVTIRNIRNLDYRTENDFDVRYYDKTFDLARLASVDLITVYWMGDAIAHVMVSFGFGGSDHVVFSIETRKEKGEEYSSIRGFFKQYELIYVVGDERDLIRVRTDYRDPAEDVYLYRTRMPRENARKLFISYVEMINGLKRKPEFYNTLTTNCTTNVVRHIRSYGGRARYTWKILLSGYAAQYAYEQGGLNATIPFEQLRRESYINPRAQAAGNAGDFSQRIREGLPFPRE